MKPLHVLLGDHGNYTGGRAGNGNMNEAGSHLPDRLFFRRSVKVLNPIISRIAASAPSSKFGCPDIVGISEIAWEDRRQYRQFQVKRCKDEDEQR